MQHSFVYGTLMTDDIVKTLIRRVPASRPALIKDHIRYRVKGAMFPAIVPAKGAEVRGKLLMDLSPREIWVLDEYENGAYENAEYEAEEYYRTVVKAHLADGVTLDANAYIWQDSLRHLLVEQPWSYDDFMTRDVEVYMDRVVKPCSNLWDLAPKELH